MTARTADTAAFSSVGAASQQMFTRVFGCLGVALLVAACTTLTVANTPTITGPLGREGWLGALCIAGQVSLAWGCAGLLPRCGSAACWAMLLGYALVDGVTFSFVFLKHPDAIAAGLFVASATFAMAAAWAAFTGLDPSRPLPLLATAAFGLALATFIAASMPDPVTTWIICAGTTGTYLALTISEIPRLRGDLLPSTDPSAQQRAGVAGAVTVQMDFATGALQLIRLLHPKRDAQKNS